MKIGARIATALVMVLGLVLGGIVLHGGGTAAASGGTTQATLRLADGTRAGTVRFDHRRQLTQVTVRLRLPEGVTGVDQFHGLHVHADDDDANGSGCIADPALAPTTWFVSADGHYARPGQVHGAHTGDLSSPLVAANGTADLTFTTGRISPADLVGRAVVLHAGPDNFGNVPVGAAADQYTPNSAAATDLTQRTGNAGARIACGEIRRG